MFLTRRMLAWRPLRELGLAVAVAGSMLASVPLAAREAPQAGTPGSVALAQLPREAQDTYRLIRAGGPFPYPKDGIAFGNRERLLPIKPRGFYREYTVATPKARDRGARRIVCGGREKTEPEACYYTDDHYASFRRIAP